MLIADRDCLSAEKSSAGKGYGGGATEASARKFAYGITEEGAEREFGGGGSWQNQDLDRGSYVPLQHVY